MIIKRIYSHFRSHFGDLKDPINHKALKINGGRGGQIRTDDFLLPKQALYQAELRPVRGGELDRRTKRNQEKSPEDSNVASELAGVGRESGTEGGQPKRVIVDGPGESLFQCEP